MNMHGLRLSFSNNNDRVTSIYINITLPGDGDVSLKQLHAPFYWRLNRPPKEDASKLVPYRSGFLILKITKMGRRPLKRRCALETIVIENVYLDLYCAVNNSHQVLTASDNMPCQGSSGPSRSTHRRTSQNHCHQHM